MYNRYRVAYLTYLHTYYNYSIWNNIIYKYKNESLICPFTTTCTWRPCVAFIISFKYSIFSIGQTKSEIIFIIAYNGECTQHNAFWLLVHIMTQQLLNGGKYITCEWGWHHTRYRSHRRFNWKEIHYSDSHTHYR